MSNQNGFKKGHQKLGGRTKGVKNKDSAQIREIFSQILSDNTDKIQADLDSLESKDRLQILIKISEFILPKLTSISGELVTEPHTIIISDGTEHGLP